MHCFIKTLHVSFDPRTDIPNHNFEEFRVWKRRNEATIAVYAAVWLLLRSHRMLDNLS